MLKAEIKEPLKMLAHEIVISEKRDNVVEHFISYRHTFLVLINFNQLTEEIKKLILIAYDRMVIDYLISRGLKFKIKDISLEELVLHTTIGGSTFLAQVKSVKKEVVNEYLILALFVFTAANTDIDQKSMEALRQGLVDLSGLELVEIEGSATDLLYPVYYTMNIHIKGLVVILIGIIIFYIALQFYIIRDVIIGIVNQNWIEIVP